MISRIILGTAQIGLHYGINNETGKLKLSESIALLDTAFNMGIRVLDTAEAYGNALEIIGLFHAKNPDKKFYAMPHIISHVRFDHRSHGQFQAQ